MTSASAPRRGRWIAMLVAAGIALPAFALGVSSDSVRDAKKRRFGAEGAPAPVADADAERMAPTDYLLKCSGCHGADGMGKPIRGIPRFANQIGHFQRTPEGRAFVMQVPGLLSAGLSDARAAAVSNYIVRRFAGDSMPPDFLPYTADEARRHRESRPADIMGKRDVLYGQLLGLGYPVE